VTRYVYTTAGDYGIGNMEPADRVHSEGDYACDQRDTVPMDCDEEHHEVKQSSEVCQISCFKIFVYSD
jgi:hypothetical protein